MTDAALITGIVGDLLPIAESLFALVDKIRTQAPDVWSAVSGEYMDAVGNWHTAEQTVHDAANATLVASLEKVPENIAPKDASAAQPVSLVGTSSAEQAAAGQPLAHYTS